MWCLAGALILMILSEVSFRALNPFATYSVANCSAPSIRMQSLDKGDATKGSVELFCITEAMLDQMLECRVLTGWHFWKNQHFKRLAENACNVSVSPWGRRRRWKSGLKNWMRWCDGSLSQTNGAVGHFILPPDSRCFQSADAGASNIGHVGLLAIFEGHCKAEGAQAGHTTAGVRKKSVDFRILRLWVLLET